MKMELVTIAHVILNRVGSASSSGFNSHRQVSAAREVPDSSSASLRELVLAIAEENGESRVQLHGLQEDRSGRLQGQAGEVIFNIDTPNVKYSAAYAACLAHPALKVGNRYFELKEIKVSPRR